MVGLVSAVGEIAYEVVRFCYNAWCYWYFVFVGGKPERQQMPRRQLRCTYRRIKRKRLLNNQGGS